MNVRFLGAVPLSGCDKLGLKAQSQYLVVFMFIMVKGALFLGYGDGMTLIYTCIYFHVCIYICCKFIGFK